MKTSVASTVSRLTPLSLVQKRASVYDDKEPRPDELRHFFDLSADLFCVAGVDGYFRSLNQAWEETLRFPREELLARPWIEFVHPEDRDSTLVEIQKLLARGLILAFENRYRCRNGSYRSLLWSATAAPEQNLIYAAARDITAQKRSEERLLRLAEALEKNSEMISMADAEGRAVFVNKALLQATGFEEPELLGKPFVETLISPRNPRALTEQFQASLHRDGRWRGECLQRRKDGSDLPILLSVSALRDSKGRFTGTFGISQDITERRELETRAMRLAQAVDHSSELICMGDSEARALFVNLALLRKSGYQQEELLGRSFNDTLLSPNNPNTLADEIRIRVIENGSWNGECLQRCKNGVDIPISLSVGVIKNEHGQITGTFGIGHDITERRTLEQQLRQAQKMEAIGRLAGGVAHDFNNLLTVIIGYADDLTSQLAAANPLHKKAEQIGKAGQRAASLTRQLLAFSRRQMLEPRVLSLNVLVEDLKKMLTRLISEDIELATSLDPNLGHVKADQGQMEQIIVNLAVNARDAMPGGGKLTIQTESVEVDAELASEPPAMPPGRYVRLRVTDIGVGMSPETQSHIFEPFFTTKELGKGTGLGLATVYGVVKQSGGFIWVSSELGQGTTFEIFLPEIRPALEASVQDTHAERSIAGSGTILLVEDDAAVRELAREWLQESGYSVIEAANGAEAVQTAEQHVGNIDLLLTDVVMPGMDGPHAADRILAFYPTTRVLYMSGYSETAASTGNSEFLKGRPLLRKPYTLPDLARAVRRTLGEGPVKDPASQ
jgi:two-component system, cell cycle sensor histidine kinase and response regulator CckA